MGLVVTSRTDDLDLQAAADHLGVHYQTAYRWVRSGKLAARLVDGSYRVAIDDIEAVQRQRATPAPVTAPGRVRVQRQADQMHRALVDGDETAARRTATRLLDEGMPVVDLIQDVLVPPLRQIGQDWHDGKLPIWVEHRASAIVERILGDAATNPRGRRRGRAMVAAVSGDMHSLPTTMAAVALRDDNWHVDHLGANMPPDELDEFCRLHDIDLAVLSSTNSEFAPLAEQTAARLRRAGVATIVGAPGQTLTGLLEQARASRTGAAASAGAAAR